MYCSGSGLPIAGALCQGQSFEDRRQRWGQVGLNHVDRAQLQPRAALPFGSPPAGIQPLGLVRAAPLRNRTADGIGCLGSTGHRLDQWRRAALGPKPKACWLASVARRAFTVLSAWANACNQRTRMVSRPGCVRNKSSRLSAAGVCPALDSGCNARLTISTIVAFMPTGVLVSKPALKQEHVPPRPPAS